MLKTRELRINEFQALIEKTIKETKEIGGTRSMTTAINRILPEDAQIPHQTLANWRNGKHLAGADFFALIAAVAPEGSWQSEFAHRALEILYPGGAAY